MQKALGWGSSEAWTLPALPLPCLEIVGPQSWLHQELKHVIFEVLFNLFLHSVGSDALFILTSQLKGSSWMFIIYKIPIHVLWEY